MTTIDKAAQEIQAKIHNQESILSFISNADLMECTDHFFQKVLALYAPIDNDEKAWHKWHFWKNGVDPFAIVASTMIGGRDAIERHLIEVENVRQIDKTISNAIGHFHQQILGHLPGCVNPGINGEIDLIVERPDLKLIAEIKNKWNTTKGDDRTQPYDKLNRLIDSTYQDHVGYYVCIITKPRMAGYKAVNKPFTPSMKKTRRPLREDIREIDGKSFYHLLTGKPDSLLELYTVFPKLLAYCIHTNNQNKSQANLIDARDHYLDYLWSHIYNVKPGLPPKATSK